MAIEYQKGDSFLHNLDARTKLMIFVGGTVIAMIIIDPILMGILFLALYLLGRNAMDKDLLNNNLKVLVLIFLTFSLFQVLWFTPDNSYFLFYLIPWKNWIPVTVQGLIRGVAVFFRFFSVVLAVHLMLYTTPPVELALTITARDKKRTFLSSALVILILGVVFFTSALPMATESAAFLGIHEMGWKLAALGASCLAFAFIVFKVLGRGLPAEMGVALMLGFATVGIMATQTKQITNAQKARGYDVQPKNIIARVKVLTALLIPIFLATMQRSQDISIAILSRGFDYNISERTYRREFTFHRQDFMVLAILFVVIVGGLLMARMGISTPTETFILSILSS